MDLLKDQFAIVTGASRGIGRATALELVRAGAGVVVNYRTRQEDAERLVAEISELGGRAAAFPADVASEADVKKLVDFAMRQFGKIDVLVCNAGIVRDQLIGAMKLEEWDSVIQTNLRGVFLCIREVLPHMMGQRSGSIIGISSVGADRGGRGHANYVASKGGLNSMVRSLAVELAPRGIRVNAVSPGIILTEMTTRIRSFAENEIRSQIPLRRFGDPEEVARAVRFLASSDASYITGEILQVTGGFGL
jgi:3-oxoacyl-[acyl-carrier protein] reductase